MFRAQNKPDLLHVIQRRQFAIYQDIEIAKQSIDERDFCSRLELLHEAIILIAEAAAGARRRWWLGVHIVEGNARDVSDVLCIPKGTDVGHRGSWGHGRALAIACPGRSGGYV